MKKKLVAVAALACAALLATQKTGAAQVPPAPPPAPALPAAATVGAGPWIVGGFMVSVASVNSYAFIVSQREHRELTSGEAIGAMVVPFGWLFLNPSAGGSSTQVPRQYRPGRQKPGKMKLKMY